jgi:hypothetical protein
MATRPQVTAEQHAERARVSHEVLELLTTSIEDYLSLHDMSTEELPTGSPLKHAMIAARAELSKPVHPGEHR